MPTILVVDDDAGVRSFISSTLRSTGFTVLTAGRAERALSLIAGRGAGIDLAVIDMAMPGMSGLDLAAELERERSPIKVLFISGYADSIAMECIARRSPEQVLLKPFSDDGLAARVVQLLARPMQRSSSSVAQPERTSVPKAS